MVTIVGRKVVMNQGEYVSFRILIRDPKGNEIPLSTSDKITLRAKYSMEAESYLSKVATPVTLVERDVPKVYHIFQFTPSDTANILSGDYDYDVILENDHRTFVVVPRSLLTLIPPILPPVIEEGGTNVKPGDDDDDSLILFGDSEDEEEDDDDLIIFGEEDEDSAPQDIIIFENDDEMDYYSIVASTPLVGSFNAVNYTRYLSTGVDEDDLIIF